MPAHGSRRFGCAGGAALALLAATPAVHAQDRAPDLDNAWRLSVQGGQSGWASGGAPGSFYFRDSQGIPFTPPNSLTGSPGFVDVSVGRNLTPPADPGEGKVQANFGVRFAEPLIANGFTPALDPRRVVGTGPRVGLQGSKPLPSAWVVEWQVGAAVLFGDRTLDLGGAGAVLPNYGSSSGSVVNLDGLLGLSYWFDSASKLTFGYRADYFSGSNNFSAGTALPNPERLDHGPMIKFTVQK